MPDKSYVSLEQHICQVCGIACDTGAVLVDRRLKASMDRHTVTGYGLCQEHRKLFDDGYVALVERTESGELTGTIVHMRRTKFDEFFTVALESDMPMVYVHPEVVELLKTIANEP